MRSAHTLRRAACLLALATLVAAPGCDWLKPSGSAGRVSPVISNLNVADPSVFCGESHPLEVSFDYNDPQDDLDFGQLLLVFTHISTGRVIGHTVTWAEPDLDLSTTPGRAICRKFFFECGAPGGSWQLAVQAEDKLGHLSNELKTAVFLSSR